MRTNTIKDRKMRSFAVTRRRQVLKEKAVEYKGGHCIICSYSKCIAALEFHHLDPREKDFALSRGIKSWDRMKFELDKCIMVCANCHREIHDEQQSEERNRQLSELKLRARKAHINTSCRSCGKTMVVVNSVYHDRITCSVKCRSSLNEVIKWPLNYELQEMVASSNKLSVAKKLGVSDKAVAKRLKKLSP